MRIRSKVEALERRASPTGECACGENRSPYMLYCRDPSVPPPPQERCPRCCRPMPRVIVRMGKGPPGTAGPPYEGVGGGLRALLLREALASIEREGLMAALPEPGP